MAGNPLLAQFHDDLRARYPVDGDGMTYSTWIKKNTRLKGRPFTTEGREYQDAIMNDMNPDLTVKKPSQVGMALSLDTPVPTPDGWTTMREIQVGDVVFDEQGAPCTVDYVSQIYLDHRCYELTFDDGQKIVADENHRWFVHSHHVFKDEAFYTGVGRPKNGSGFAHEGIVRTSFLSANYKVGKRHRFAIPTTAALQTKTQILPVDPYFLGAWLGDGNLHAAVLTAHVDDAPYMEENLRVRGFTCLPSSRKGDVVQFRVHDASGSLHTPLATLGLICKSKSIPTQYLRANREQRLELIRGLLDTDGTITKNGRVSFSNTNPNIVAGFEELVRSIGLKTRTRWRPPSKSSVLKNGQTICGKLSCAEVSFAAYADSEIFALPRKAARLRATGRHTETFRRRLMTVECVPTTPVRCISVNSPSHLFLAGRGMIPTHNTEIQVRKIAAILTRNRGTTGIFTFPNETMYKRNSKTRIRPLITSEPVFNLSAFDDKPSRAMDLYEIAGSFLYVTGMTEGDATSIPADFLFHDEIDLSTPSIISLYQSRLQDSDHKVTQTFGTPTLPGYGVDAKYLVSDRKEYQIVCRGCNHWQVPKFTPEFYNLPGFKGQDLIQELDADTVAKCDLENSYLRCEKCSRALNMDDPKLREWVAEYPTRRQGGYWVRPFSTTRIKPHYVVSQLLRLKVDDDGMKVFYNTVLGETFSDGNAKLEPDVVRLAMSGPASPKVGADVPVALGCDMGRICHLTLGRVRGDLADPFHFEQVNQDDLEDRIAELRRKYKIITGGVDRLPFTPTANRIREQTKGIILPLEYRQGSNVNLRKNEDDVIAYAEINRTAAIDAVVRSISSKPPQIDICGYGSLGTLLVEQLCDMVRVEVDEKQAVWQKLTGNDHFLHSLVLMRAALKVRQVIIMTNADQPKRLFGMLSIPSLPATQLGSLRPKERHAL
jgi:hypothetical protein